MLFTSIPLARSQSTSQVFLDHGITNEAPGAVSDLRISVVTTYYNIVVNWFIQNIWMCVAAYFTERAIPVGKTTSSLGSRFVTGLFRAPSLIVTFPGKISEETAARLAELGFTLQTKAHYRFYKGPATESNVIALVSMGANADAYAEYGTTNCNGFTALTAIDNFIYGLLVFMADLPTHAANLKKQENVETSIEFSARWDAPTFIASKDDLPSKGKGILFPYFNGLVTSDKAMPVKFIIDRFHRALGNTPAEILRNTCTLQEGWTSLATTAAGCAISHLVYGISLALDGCLNLQVVYINGQYRGFVIFGEAGFAMLKGKTVVKPYSMEDLGAELDELSKHNHSLTEIARILSGLELRVALNETVTSSTGSTTVPVKERPVYIADIDTPRKLYNAICKRKTTPDSTKELQAFVLKLEYQQTYWALSDTDKVALAAQTIFDRKQPAVEVPFAYKTAALYNLDPVASVLAAFGPIAPSLIASETGNGIVPLLKDGRTYEATKGFNLTGAPIFAKSLQNATVDWNTILNCGVIRFRQSGNDRAGKAKINERHTIIPKGSKPYEIINRVLSAIAVASADKKRKRVEEDVRPVDPKVEDERRSKKAKKENDLLAIYGDPEKPMDVDSIEDF